MRTTDANGKATHYAYDGLNRMTNVVRDPGGSNLVCTVRYDERSRPPTIRSLGLIDPATGASDSIYVIAIRKGCMEGR